MSGARWAMIRKCASTAYAVSWWSRDTSVISGSLMRSSTCDPGPQRLLLLFCHAGQGAVHHDSGTNRGLLQTAM